MKFFDAVAAKKANKLYTSKGTNYQRNKILDRIKAKAIGSSTNYIVLDDDQIVLFEDDYKFFEQLGYTIEREVRSPGYRRFAVIQW